MHSIVARIKQVSVYIKCCGAGGSLAQGKDFTVSAFSVAQGSPHQRPDCQAETWRIRKSWPDEEQGKDAPGTGNSTCEGWL